MSGHARTLLSHLHRLTTPSLPDAILLARWRDQRDHDAFALLTARHGPMVLGVCRRILGDVQDAEDAFQATFLVLSRKAAKLRRPEALASFLYGVAVRLARKVRAAVKRRKMVQPAPEAPEPIDPRPQPLDVLSGRELLALLDAEIARLPEVYRLPLLLCLLQGRTVEEASRQIGWSIGSLRGRLERGREQLRRRLSRRGLGLSMGAVALLAPAAVSEKLLAESVQHLSGPVPTAIGGLAGSAIPGLKLKIVCLSLFLIMAVGFGAGLFQQAPIPDKPTAPTLAVPSAQANDAQRRDIDGEPLPSGAIARLGTRRFRLDGGVQSLAFSPDGKTVAAASGHGVCFFDAATGKRSKHIPPPDSASPGDLTVTFSPDGKRLAVATRKFGDVPQKCVVQVWEWDHERKILEIDAVPLVWLGWSPDGEPLVVFMEEGALRLRELASGRSRRFECKDLPNISQVRYMVCTCAPGGQTLAIADYQPAVHVWDTKRGRERCTLRPKGSPIALALSPDGRILASVTSEAAQLWDTATGKVKHTLMAEDKRRSNAVFSPDGKTLATVDTVNGVRFWDVATGRERGRLQSDTRFSSRIAISPDGKVCATAEDPMGLAFHLWNVSEGTRRPEAAGHIDSPRGIAFSPHGSRVATYDAFGSHIRVWNPANGEQLVKVRHFPYDAVGCAFSVDGRRLFSSWTDGTLRVFDSKNGQEQKVIRLIDPDRPDPPQSNLSSHISHEGKRLVSVSYYTKFPGGAISQDILITGWDIATWKQLFRRRRSGGLHLAVSADTRVLAVPRQFEPNSPRNIFGRCSMHLEDLETGERLLTFPEVKGITIPLAFSPDGRLLASYTHAEPREKTKNTLRLWETASAAEVLALPAPGFPQAAFSPDGQMIALSASERQLLIWDLAQGRELQRIKGVDAEVTTLRFSPDDLHLVSGLSDTTLLVWDVGRRRMPPRKLAAEGVSKAWAELAGSDAACAIRARWTLASTPDDAIPFLKDHLHPVKSADPQHLRRLLADLDNEQFAVREKAKEELVKLGDLAESALRETLANKPSLEVRQRVQAVLECLHSPVTLPELLQALRAVAALEDIGTPEARRLLQELTKGAPEARLTREAKESLRRLDLRNSSGR